MSTWPAMVSVSAGPPPRYGMCTMATPAIGLEQLGRHVERAAAAGRAVGQLAGLGLGQREQLLQVLRRQVVVDHQHVLGAATMPIGARSFSVS